MRKLAQDTVRFAVVRRRAPAGASARLGLWPRGAPTPSTLRRSTFDGARARGSVLRGADSGSQPPCDPPGALAGGVSPVSLASWQARSCPGGRILTAWLGPFFKLLSNASGVSRSPGCCLLASKRVDIHAQGIRVRGFRLAFTFFPFLLQI